MLGERVALAAIGAATASAPGTATGDLAADLPRLCELIDHSLVVGGSPVCPA
ncbi:hypothetical protein [Kitasatospora sp. GP82]|uniref:hypothetical protein n=1 Tax=Kitasatospora sp. GP82 TaxID=3035089 RepID=UPI0024768B03|nr:hypothetical protein [Kitasatospora sp. GP82]